MKSYLFDQLIWVSMLFAAVLCCSGCDAERQVSPCANPNETLCGICVDTSSSLNHCGSCGNACASGSACVAGECAGDDGGMTTPDSGVDSGDSACAPGCRDGQLCCDAMCILALVEPSTLEARDDPSYLNCGSCGRACGPEASRCGPSAGGAPVCQCGSGPACAVGATCTMDGTGALVCRNTTTDPFNCGEEGNVCGGESACRGGMCVCGAGGACTDGTTCCGGACIPSADDDNNCGGCGIVCGDGTSCAEGECRCGDGPACTPPSAMGVGQSCCDGACVDNTDANCGCGVACEESNACIFGAGLTGGTPMLCCGFAIAGMGICGFSL